MFQNLMKLLQPKKSSLRIEQSLVDNYVRNPKNPFLVSFPRTGSHWLRMLMELYYERPTLVRAFYFPEKTDYLLYHTHDMELDVERENLIYLYREPVATIYSQLSFYDEDSHDENRIQYWADLYGQHLLKWLVNERFSQKKTVISYEQMQSNMILVFENICKHFGESLEQEKLEKVMKLVTKEVVKEKTQAHDERVVKLGEKYSQSGAEFKANYTALVWESLLKNRLELKAFFNHETD